MWDLSSPMRDRTRVLCIARQILSHWTTGEITSCAFLHSYMPRLGASLVAQLVKNPPAMPETSVQFLGQEDSPREGIGYPLQYSWVSQVAQTIKICLQCRRPGFDPWVAKILWRREWKPTLVFLLGESPWTEEPGGLQSMWSQRVGHDWATKNSTARYKELL